MAHLEIEKPDGPKRQRSKLHFNWYHGHNCCCDFLSGTVISGRLPARPITRTGRLLHTAKKKVNGLPAPVDNPHVVIQLFRWRKRDIKAIHFSLSIQTCAQFCVNISLYFIDKIIQ